MWTSLRLARTVRRLISGDGSSVTAPAQRLRSSARAAALATIRPSDRVIDLGCGHQPDPRADVYVDWFTEDDIQRDGARFDWSGVAGKQFVRWNLDGYPWPFRDKEFDFVIACHIAEHLEDPYRFCLEVQRIGRRGYIETPSRFYEELYGWPFHRWHVSVVHGALVFENIRERTFLGTYIRHLYHQRRDPDFVRLHDEHFNRLLTSFSWEGGFSFSVHVTPQ